MSHKLMGRISQHSLICLILVVLSMDAVEAEEGIKQFNKCIACHTLVPGTHLAGPSLHGLRGRPAGSLPGWRT